MLHFPITRIESIKQGIWTLLSRWFAIPMLWLPESCFRLGQGLTMEFTVKNKLPMTTVGPMLTLSTMQVRVLSFHSDRRPLEHELSFKRTSLTKENSSWDRTYKNWIISHHEPDLNRWKAIIKAILWVRPSQETAPSRGSSTCNSIGKTQRLLLNLLQFTIRYASWELNRSQYIVLWIVPSIGVVQRRHVELAWPNQPLFVIPIRWKNLKWERQW
jgi:hypothetical protein